MASTTKKMKKKQAKKLVKPITRSSNKPFESSDTAEVKASARGLEKHLEKHAKDEDIPQVERDQFRAEVEAIINDISKELTTVGNTLVPRLIEISKVTNMPDAMKASKGAWLYSEEIRELGVEEPPNIAPPEQSQSPQSPKPSGVVTRSESKRPRE